MPTSSKNRVMFGVPSFISSQSQQLGQNLNLGQEYTPETAAKMQALERKQQIANILLQQGMIPKEARQAGRFVVAPSMWEQASGPLTTALGSLASMYLDNQRAEVAADERQRVAQAYQAYQEGTSDVPAYVGRTVPGTGVEGVEAQPAIVEPSNLESIIAANQTPAAPSGMRKRVEDVTNALAQRQMPPLLQSNPQWDGPAAVQTPYRPAVELTPAVPGVVGKPDRRESPYEALEREFGDQAAQDFANNGFAPGTTPETASRMERVVKDAERPDAPGRPRTPGELMAADTALLASGAPGAWPLIQLTKQQREMDLARKETLEERKQESAWRREGTLLGMQQRHDDLQAQNETRKRELDFKEQQGLATLADRHERTEIQRQAQRSEERYQRDMADLRRRDLEDRATTREEKAKIAKDSQQKVASYASRMEMAEDDIESTEASSNWYAIGIAGTLGKLPFGLGDAAGAGINMGMSPQTQRQYQARRNFINAILRRESGATITASEFTNAAAQYFAQVGDSAEVLAQKKANRLEAIRGMVQEAGPAWKGRPRSPQIDQELEDIKNIYKGKP